MRLGLTCVAAAMLFCLPLAHATTIDFNGAPNRAPLTTYTEQGFSVVANIGGWLFNGFLGNPGPSIFIDQPGSVQGSIIVSENGTPFTFSRVDLTNDVAIADYTIEGFNGTTLAFAVNGTLPTNSTGSSNFQSYGSGHSDTLITSLLIGETYAGGNPDGTIDNDVNVDNIVLNAPATQPTGVTPEPSSIALLGTGLLFATAKLRKRSA